MEPAPASRIRRTSAFSDDLLAALLILLVFWFGAVSPSARAAMKQTANVELDTVEFAAEPSASAPAAGWKAMALPLTPAALGADAAAGFWLRLPFARPATGEDLALMLDRAPPWQAVLLNGSELYLQQPGSLAGYPSPFAPAILSLPAEKLVSGSNAVTIRFAETGTVAGIRIGTVAALVPRYQRDVTLAVEAPRLINAILAALGRLALVFWLMRRKEITLAWLALMAALWFFSNLRFLVMPAGSLEPALRLAALGLLYTFWGMGISLFRFKNSLAWLAAGAAATLLIAPALLAYPAEAATATAILGLAAMPVLAQYAWGTWQAPGYGNLLAAGATLAGVAALLHDQAVAASPDSGAGFNLSPYAALLCVSIFVLSFGRRLLAALSLEENLNILLENRSRAATASLAASEAARRVLMVANAVNEERDRLMREIHDGIGSSLIAAIAASERQAEPVNAVAILKRVLTDLRVAVDSLEPVQGNVPTLLASLRHRLEPDFRKAGIAFDWRVEEVPELDWLDSVNALHVLRIFQEAFANVVSHAQATRVAVRCFPEDREGGPGITVEVSDNGRGFADRGGTPGHGLRNMASRAEALDAVLTTRSEPGNGTTVSLWLPLRKGLDS
jgi:signal transduction histidine kinase